MYVEIYLEIQSQNIAEVNRMRTGVEQASKMVEQEESVAKKVQNIIYTKHGQNLRAEAWPTLTHSQVHRKTAKESQAKDPV